MTDKLVTKDTVIDGDASRHAALAMDAETFRRLGHRLVDQVAGFLETLPLRPVTRDESPSAVREALNLTGPLPESGMDPGLLLEETAELLFTHSLFNGHPRFFGYVTAPPAPIGIFGDFLAAAVNPNVGAWTLSPAATEIESQTVRWIASLIGYPVNCGGLLVSGGNMANFVCFLAARAAKAGWDVREHGVSAVSGGKLRVYASVETHTWIQKAANLYAPLEAGCALVRDAESLRAAFAYHPPYYHFNEQATNYVDYGPQNSRGFRALKVWLALRQVGAEGYRMMIAEDIRLSQAMAQSISRHADLELITQHLSITTFRYVPRDLRANLQESQGESYLDRLNGEILDRLQRGGETFVSNAVVRGCYLLRACIVNFYTSQADVEAVPGIVAGIGRAVDSELRLAASQPE